MSYVEPERVLAVGGAGYVGTAFCEQLSERNIAFAAYDNFSVTSEDEFRRNDWQYYREDITDRQAILGAVRDFKPTHIINFAALHFIPYCVKHPEEVKAVNIDGTQNVIDSIRVVDENIHFTHTSSAAVYDNVEHRLSEDDTLAPIDIYGESKLIGEQLVRSQVSTYNIVRLFNVYGRRDPHPHVIPRVFAELSAGASELQIGDTRPQRDFVHVEDVARAICAVLTRGNQYDTYNIGTGTAHTVKDVIRLLSDQCDNHPRILDNTPNYNRATDRMLLQADISKITKDTGWTPDISFRQGLQTLS